jgi:hypothetical protein
MNVSRLRPTHEDADLFKSAPASASSHSMIPPAVVTTMPDVALTLTWHH